MSQGKCSFSHPGTLGHECGDPAVLTGISKSLNGTVSGLFYSLRCLPCSKIKGGENADIEQWEKFDPAKHVNRWPSN